MYLWPRPPQRGRFLSELRGRDDPTRRSIVAATLTGRTVPDGPVLRGVPLWHEDHLWFSDFFDPPSFPCPLTVPAGSKSPSRANRPAWAGCPMGGC